MGTPRPLAVARGFAKGGVVQVREALLVEGASKFAILCYGIFPVDKLESALESLRSREELLNSRVHRFLGDGWPNGVVLDEILVARQEDIPLTTAEALLRMIEVDTCLASVCMYDGAFGGYHDIFAPEIASQTYAFCFSEGEPAISLDTNVLESREWGSIVAHARERLG
jgi:hypothetical protein